MTEPDVALTDFGLAIEGVVLAWLLLRQQVTVSPVRRFFALQFLAGAAGALLGGVTHGFLLGQDTPISRGVWSATLLALGLSAYLVWRIVAELCGTRWKTAIQILAGLQLAGFVALVLFVTQQFALAAANALPAILALLFVAVADTARRGGRPQAAIITGLSLTLAGGAIQRFQIAIDPHYFNHNALFHVVQAAALLFIYAGVRGLEDLARRMRG